MAFCKYFKEEEYVSYDGGVSWTAMGVYRKGDLIEYGSSDCPDTSYVFHTSGLTNYTYTTDSESKVGVVFNITSTYEGVYQDFTVSCGCGTDFLTVTKGSGNITLNIAANTTTDERYCPITLTQNSSGNQIIIVIDQTSASSPQYRWIDLNPSIDYYCSGTTKYYKQQEQVSLNGGISWENVVPAQYRWGDSAETESTDCGYVPTSSYTIPYTASSKLNVSLSNFTPAATAETYDSTAMTGQVEFSSAVTSISHHAFYNCSGLTSIAIPNSVTSIGQSAFNGCSGLTSVSMSNGLTSIEINTFIDCSSLTSITIPNSVTSIGDRAFRGCSGLTSVTIGSGVTTISTDAFDTCTSLLSITIPNSVTTIGDGAFQGCSSLTSVTIGSGITSIGNNAFYQCNGLTSVTVEATTPPTIGYIVFYSSNCPIYVPSGSVSAYQSAWSNYASRIQAIP